MWPFKSTQKTITRYIIKEPCDCGMRGWHQGRMLDIVYCKYCGRVRALQVVYPVIVLREEAIIEGVDKDE